MYKILAVISLSCLIISLLRKPRKMKINNFSKQFRRSIIFQRLDKIISESKFFNKTIKEYISKLQLINFKSYEFNNELILKYVVIDAVISLFIFIILSHLITMWYAIVIISIAFFYLIILLGENIIDYMIIRIHRQFPAALQCFLNEYIINKNIKDAINNSYYKMPKKIGGAFEMLARELSGEKKYENAIKRFANKLSYIWGHSFAEILIMSYEGTGDITEELMILNRLVSEEITAEEEEKSSKFANKMTFIIIYIFTLIGFVFNIANNDLASYLYFYTSTGNTLIAVWIAILIIRITYTSISERGR